MTDIDDLEKELNLSWQHASGATSGGEGMARMIWVREAQMKLARAYVASGKDEDLLKAKRLFIDVFSDVYKGFEYTDQLSTLKAVCDQLKDTSDNPFEGIYQKHMDGLNERMERNQLFSKPTNKKIVSFVEALSKYLDNP